MRKKVTNKLLRLCIKFKHHKKSFYIFFTSIFLILLSIPAFAENTTAKLDKGDTAWMLISTALVILMTPGLALFYGGMVRKKNILSTIMGMGD